MGTTRTYLQTDHFKNLNQSSAKPVKAQGFYEPKPVTEQELIHKKLKKIAKFLKGFYPKIEGSSGTMKQTIKKNLGLLNQDLSLMQKSLHKNPYAFNTDQLKTNQECIKEMKHVCESLQQVKAHESEHKRLSQIKHVLHELEQLVQPPIESAPVKKAPLKKESTPIAKKEVSKAKPKMKTPVKLQPTEILKLREPVKLKTAPVLKVKAPVKPKKKAAAPVKKAAAPKKKASVKAKKTAAPKKKAPVKAKKTAAPKKKAPTKSAVKAKTPLKSKRK